MAPITLEAPAVSAPPIEDDGERYEIIDGKRVEMPPVSAFAVRVAAWIVFEINTFARANKLGEAVPEMLFRLPLPRSRNRRPDGAFISYKRWPKGRPQPGRDNAWDVVPDLVIEAVSPTDHAEELLIKVEEYFRAGVSLVWVVYPNLRLIHIYESMTRIRVATAADELDGGAVLPGFRIAVASLFPEVVPEAGAASDN